MLLLAEEGVKIKINMIIRKAVHQIWHFIDGPIKSSPFQFIITYPIIIPIIPNKEVEAPALTPEGEQSRLKIFPHIPAIR
jgi:hypothetical protein